MPSKVSGIILLISLGLGLTTKRAYVKNMSTKEISSKEQQERVKQEILVPSWMFKNMVCLPLSAFLKMTTYHC